MDKRLAVFDLDGTLTRHDTMFLFLRYVSGSWLNYVLRMFVALPVLAAYALGLRSGSVCKLDLLNRFLQSIEPCDLAEKCAGFVGCIDRDLRPAAASMIKCLKDEGFTTVLCSASPSLWLKPWGRAAGFDYVVCTELERNVAGKFLYRTPNCKGDEKVRRLQALFGSRLTIDMAFGDSSDDRPMLAIARKAYMNPDFRMLLKSGLSGFSDGK